MDILEIKKYGNIEHDEDDSLLEELKLTAEEYLDGAGIKNNYTKHRYKLAIKILVIHWYDNRNVQGEEKTLPYGLKSLIEQLRWDEDEV